MKAGDYKVVFDGLKKFKESMKSLMITDVLVGIPASADSRMNSEDEEINNASIGYIQENGSALANIPPRPHLIPGVKAVAKEVADEFKKAAQQAFENPQAVVKYYTRAGIIASNSVKKFITDQINFEELSERTLRARKSKGFQGDKALIRTGQYRNAITYVVEGKD